MSTAGLSSIRQTRPIVRPGHDVGDEQLLAVDDVLVADAFGTGAQRRQVGAGAGLGQGEGRKLVGRWPSRGRKRCFCSALPNVRTGSTAPMQPCTEARPATVGSTMAIRVRNGAKAANGAPSRRIACRPAGPSSRRRPARRARRRRSCVRSSSSVPASRCRRTTSSEPSITRSTSGGVVGDWLVEQLDRQLAVPHRAVHRAVDGLILRGEQRLDLVVGLVDRAGAAGFFVALAAELQGGFGERSAVRWRARLIVARGWGAVFRAWWSSCWHS